MLSNTDLTYTYLPQIGDVARIIFDGVVYERQISEVDGLPGFEIVFGNPATTILKCLWQDSFYGPGHIEILIVSSSGPEEQHTVKIEVYRQTQISEEILSPIYIGSDKVDVISALNAIYEAKQMEPPFKSSNTDTPESE